MFNYAQSQGLVQMLASLNVVLTQAVLDIVMFTSETQVITTVLAMPPAMREMTAVQMHWCFASVRAIILLYAW
jgi:hypothetical protein